MQNFHFLFFCFEFRFVSFISKIRSLCGLLGKISIAVVQKGKKYLLIAGWLNLLSPRFTWSLCLFIATWLREMSKNKQSGGKLHMMHVRETHNHHHTVSRELLLSPSSKKEDWTSKKNSKRTMWMQYFMRKSTSSIYEIEKAEKRLWSACDSSRTQKNLRNRWRTFRETNE